ncbi:Enoyl-CoA hydratase domain-containing protein 3 mitochondrial [Trichostrongylus colubriformis]|uniref:Enoyl-CoA hydratase domain-containing protein 3, mitochondrial n=1 Tax=Trichostrongylus colubriformis TaxID=6319 RepID=A0AAN8IUA1_TRICO
MMIERAQRMPGGDLAQAHGETVVRLILKDVKRRNALSLDMIEELTKELKEINSISKVRSVIISSEGPAFSSGHDLRELVAEKGPDLHQKIFDKCSNLMMLMRSMEVPVIAEVHGVAAAAGCQLVASCDIVVAADNSKFMVPGQRVGLFCSTPGIALARAVPNKVALDMLFTAEPIDAQTALRCGLVSRIVPETEVKFEALRVAEQIGQHSRSVTALGKAFFYTQIELGLNEAYRYGGKVMTENLKMKDAQEGISAFTEKRQPTFGHTNDKC